MVFDDRKILSGINARDKQVFGKLYSLWFRELYYYASKLYMNTEIEPGDEVQDAFLSLWQSRHTDFETLSNVKAYLFVTIKKRFKKYLRRNNYKTRFVDYSENELESYQADVFEIEILSLFHHVINILPEQTAQIFKLFFMGWSAEEIAEHMGKSKQTVYNIKSQAMSILREKLSKDTICILISLFS